jgi:hypothetical protein
MRQQEALPAVPPEDLTELLRRRPPQLPPALVHSEPRPNIRGPQWTARALPEDQVPAVVNVLRELEERLRPARREWIIAILSRLAVHYPNASADPDAFGIVLSDMADDLAEFSELHLVQACAEWRRTEKWFPKIPEMHDKLFRLYGYDVVMRRRARILLGIDEAQFYDLPADRRTNGEPPPPEFLVDIEDRLKTLPEGLATSIRGLIAAANKPKPESRE